MGEFHVKQTKKGFTLLELMFAMTITSIIGIVIVRATINSMSMWRTTSDAVTYNLQRQNTFYCFVQDLKKAHSVTLDPAEYPAFTVQGQPLNTVVKIQEIIQKNTENKYFLDLSGLGADNIIGAYIIYNVRMEVDKLKLYRQLYIPNPNSGDPTKPYILSKEKVLYVNLDPEFDLSKTGSEQWKQLNFAVKKSQDVKDRYQIYMRSIGTNDITRDVSTAILLRY
mgnify:FL=1